MKILVDSREQLCFAFSGPKYPNTTTERATLYIGDYSIPGLDHQVAIERKSLDDLAGSITQGRERFEKELQRSMGLEFFAIVVEAEMGHIAKHSYRSRMNPKSFIQTMFAYQVRYGCHVVWAGSRIRAEYATYSLLQKFVMNKHKEIDAVIQAAS